MHVKTMVEELIEQFLYLNNECPLPGLGKLSMETKSAFVKAGEQKLSPPLQIIKFVSADTNSADFIAFIAKNKKISAEAASAMLNEFCQQIIELKSKQKISINQTGYFYKEGNVAIEFKQIITDDVLTPAVNLNHVVHPVKEGKLLVGDAELPIEFMKEYIAASKMQKAYQWWIAAACMGIVSIAMIVVYLTSFNAGKLFGNAASVEINSETITYKKVN